MSWGILRRSNRGERPTQQGDGSEKQIPYREAFQNCVLLWNSLPAECPEVIPDPPPTSKASVWEAKLEHGVVCSYYDLFMRCCMGYAQAHGGAMPDGDCFPCEVVCDCEDILIGYTTQGMQVDEEQTLTVEGGVDGCVYSWAIISGGGELSAGTGTSVIYTASASNPDCDENATISLSVEENTCDTLEIAINAGPSGDIAYWVNTGAIYQGWYFFQPYYCSGSRYGGGGWWPDQSAIRDVRTPQMIADGCCPGAVL